jgi:nicotinate-nucleotide adenylyltransferase
VKTVIGVFGGSFDPIHRGHLAPVEDVRARLGLDEVVFVPAASPPHKPGAAAASPAHRFAMAALAIAPFERFRLSDFEVSREGTTYSVDTLAHFRALYRGAEIVLVVGSDTLVTLPTWRAWREIASGYRIAVVARAPYDLVRTRRELDRELLARLAPEGVPLRAPRVKETIHWGGNDPVTISSTWVRHALKAGRKLAEAVPPPVEAYVRRNGLYAGPDRRRGRVPRTSLRMRRPDRPPGKRTRGLRSA